MARQQMNKRQIEDHMRKIQNDPNAQARQFEELAKKTQVERDQIRRMNPGMPEFTSEQCMEMAAALRKMTPSEFKAQMQAAEAAQGGMGPVRGGGGAGRGGGRGAGAGGGRGAGPVGGTQQPADPMSEAKKWWDDANARAERVRQLRNLAAMSTDVLKLHAPPQLNLTNEQIEQMRNMIAGTSDNTVDLLLRFVSLLVRAPEWAKANPLRAGVLVLIVGALLLVVFYVIFRLVWWLVVGLSHLMGAIVGGGAGAKAATLTADAAVTASPEAATGELAVAGVADAVKAAEDVLGQAELLELRR